MYRGRITGRYGGTATPRAKDGDEKRQKSHVTVMDHVFTLLSKHTLRVLIVPPVSRLRVFSDPIQSVTRQLRGTVPVATAHTMAHVAAVVSIGAGAVGFVQVSHGLRESVSEYQDGVMERDSYSSRQAIISAYCTVRCTRLSQIYSKRRGVGVST